MRRIQRYVFVELLGPTLVGLLAYGLILLMNLSLEAAEMAIRRDLPLSLVGQFILLSLPRILVLTIPMAVLVGILVGIGRLTADNEIAALRALGYNDSRLLLPAVMLGCLSGLLTFALFDFSVPASNYAQHQLQARIFLSSDLNREIQPRTFFEKIPNLLVYADAESEADGTLKRVLIYQKNPDGAEEVSTAQRARIEYQEGRGALSFRLENVASHSWNRATPDTYQVAHRDEETIIRPPDVFTTEMIRSLKEPPPRNLREQSVTQLRQTIEEIRKIPKGGARRKLLNEARVELHKKFAIPGTCLSFALLGLVLGLSQRRGGKAWGFVISFFVIAIQYSFLSAGEQLADRGQISAWLAMWMGNAIFAALAVVLLFFSRRWSWDPSAIFGRLRLRYTASRRQPAPSSRIDEAAGAPASSSSPAGGPAAPASTAGAAASRGNGRGGRSARGRWLPTIDIYLVKTFAPVALLVVLSLSLLFALFSSLDLVDDLARTGQPLTLLLHYVASVLPMFVVNYVLPVGLCASTLITFALLSRTHELTAIRSAGLGPFRVSAAFVLVAIVCSALSLAALDSVLPATNQKAIQVRDQIRGRSPRSYRHPERRWVFGSRGDLVTFSDFNRERQEILDLGVFRFQPGTFTIKERIFAQRAAWDGKGWILSDGWQREFTSAGETFDAFRRRVLQEMDGPEYFVQEWKAPDQMKIAELRAYVADMEHRGNETRDLRVGLHRKIAIPAVCLVMVLIALPFGLRIEGRGALFGLGLALLLAAIYYFIMQACGKLGEVGVLPPILAAWGPNMVFSAAALYLMAWSRW